MNSILLYLKFVRMSFRSQLRYPASFAMSAFGNLVATGIDFIAVYSFFARFGRLGPWTLAEVALFYGMTNLAFALSEAYMRGFDTFQNHVNNGDFDRVLLRPRTAFLQMLGSEFQLRRIGRFLNGLVPTCWALASLQLSWGIAEWCLFLLAIAGGSLLYSGIILVRATTCFWTVSSLELFNMITYGGVETSQYPIDIYSKWVRRFFCAIVPLASINYWPASFLLGKGYVPALASWLSPLAGAGFFVLGMLVWRFGVRHYRSTGS